MPTLIARGPFVRSLFGSLLVPSSVGVVTCSVDARNLMSVMSVAECTVLSSAFTTRTGGRSTIPDRARLRARLGLTRWQRVR